MGPEPRAAAHLSHQRARVGSSMHGHVERRDVVIVGGGPAGSGTALALERLDPGLAGRTLLLDGATFPREKTCAGGLIPHTLELLHALDLELAVPAVRVDHARVDAGAEAIEIESPGCCWVVRRREFDAMLLEASRARGVEVRTGVKVTGAARRGAWIRLSTSSGELEARAVVGADGAGSLIRRALVTSEMGWLARAVMCDVPMEEASAPKVYHFDFRGVFEGLPGYAWAFPCLIEGHPHWNVGAYSLRRRGEGRRLERLLAERGGSGVHRRRAHPIRLYRGAMDLRSPGVLLVGDAAGVDALLGEGISFCLEYGRIAAQALIDGFARGDLGFADYGERVARSAMGRKLRRLALGARLFYGARSRFWFWVSRLSPTAQRIGMNWYNGVGSFRPAVVALRPPPAQ